MLKFKELLFGVGTMAAAVGGNICVGRLHVETSGFTGSEVPEDREVREEE